MLMWVGAASGIALGVISGAILLARGERLSTKQVAEEPEPSAALRAPAIVDLDPSAFGVSTTGFVQLVNSGGQAVEIIDVWSSCGCTTTREPPFTVEAQSSFRVPVEMSASMRPGVAASTLRLTTAAGEAVQTQVRQSVVAPLPQRAALRPDASASIAIHGLYSGLIERIECYPSDADQPLPHRLERRGEDRVLVIEDVRGVPELDVVVTLGPPVERRVAQRISIDAGEAVSTSDGSRDRPGDAPSP